MSDQPTLEAGALTAPATSPETGGGTAPYAVRRITLVFQVGDGPQLIIKGLRVAVHVELANTPTTGGAIIRVYGMTLDHMNQMSRAGMVFEQRDKNYVLVQAGDDVSGMTTIFNGFIVEAYPDMKDMPNTSFFIHAVPANIIQLKPVEPTSFAGATDVDTALGAIAKKAGLTLENNGVKAILASPYFPGTAWSQILSCVQAADCFAYLDGITKTLAVWPKNSSRSGGKTIVSPDTGMIGYPQFQLLNILVRTLFTTEIRPTEVGRVVQVKSQLQAANGDFTVISVVHDLISEMPGGPWETTFLATPVKQL